MLILQVIGCYQLRRSICTWCTLNQQCMRHFVKHSQPFLDQLIWNFTTAVFSLHSASSLVPRPLAVLKVWGQDYSACLFAFASFTWLALHLNFLRLLFFTPLCLALCHYFFGTAMVRWTLLTPIWNNKTASTVAALVTNCILKWNECLHFYVRVIDVCVMGVRLNWRPAV